LCGQASEIHGTVETLTRLVMTGPLVIVLFSFHSMRAFAMPDPVQEQLAM
jgi:hypothetical protein